ncbi:MAG TPA: GNAT family acetyltransferase [Candidatus Limnocylindrales bacterium]|jgi:ribosomal protein S18 acetylase RimI-like enzyme
MEIRTALDADRDDVIALWEATALTRPWNDPVADFDRAVTGPASAVLVGTEGGTATATAMVGHDGHRGWIYYLAVRPDRQGHGHGLAMMRACERWLGKRGIGKVQLMVRDTNVRVIGFYEAIGYERQAVVVLGRWLPDQAEADGPEPPA